MAVLIDRLRQDQSDTPVDDEFNLDTHSETVGIELSEPMVGIMIGEIILAWPQSRALCQRVCSA